MSSTQPNGNKRNPKPAVTRRQPRTRKPNTKRTGERSEAAFLHKANGLGLVVAKPWGDSERYDFILDNGERLFRVQIKATDVLRAQAYETRATYTTGKTRAVYTRKDIDFLIAHVIPLDLWYILPVEVCTPAPMLRFYPHRKAKKMRLEKYREAWHLLAANGDSPSDDAPLTLHASADEGSYEPECDAGAPARESPRAHGSWPVPKSLVILNEARLMPGAVKCGADTFVRRL